MHQFSDVKEAINSWPTDCCKWLNAILYSLMRVFFGKPHSLLYSLLKIFVHSSFLFFVSVFLFCFYLFDRDFFFLFFLFVLLNLWLFDEDLPQQMLSKDYDNSKNKPSSVSFHKRKKEKRLPSPFLKNSINNCKLCTLLHGTSILHYLFCVADITKFMSKIVNIKPIKIHNV